ncbi:Ger(x)C family spore germination protein [Paenibacillus flagellatus]|nr:Ger(x)C family spore germination protein [Paenibacillus flagellatus]
MKVPFASVRTIVRLVLALPLLVLLTAGCWDRREIEERTSVVALAIDRDRDNPQFITLSVQIPIPIRIAGSGAGGGGGDGKNSVKVMSATGKTVVDAFQNLQKRLNQELFYGHTRIIAIGDDVAKEGLIHILDPFRRDPQIRRLLWPIIVKGNALELLNAVPTLEQIPTVFIMSLIENGAKSGRIPDVNLGDFFIDLSSASREAYMNYVEVNKNDVKWCGVGVFRGDRMIGKLDERETWNLIHLREKKGGGNIVFPYENDPSKLVTLNTEFVSSKKNISFQDGKTIVRIHVELESNLLEKTFDMNLFQEASIKRLEQQAEKYLNEGAADLVRKLQRQYKTDTLGIGSYIKAHHTSEWKRMDWERQFPEADIRITYRIRVRNPGMELR